MADQDLVAWRMLEYLWDHFATSDAQLMPPIGVPGVIQEQEATVLSDLYEGQYIEGILGDEHRCPVIVTGLTELGRQAVAGYPQRRQQP
jgi:hypothetical protein